MKWIDYEEWIMTKNKLKILVNKLTPELFRDLMELMIYYKMSYPVGEYKVCGVKLDDATNRILTEDIIYKCTDDVYMELYICSNEVIGKLYKYIYERNETNKI